MAQSKASPETPPSRTTAAPKPLLLPQLQTLHKDNSSDLATSPSVTYTEVPEKVQSRKIQPWQRTGNESLRRMESNNPMAQSKTNPESLLSRTTATLKPLLLPQLQTLRDDNSSDVPTLLGEAYIERQQALQIQFDKALAELRDVQVESKRLTSENGSRQRSIAQLNLKLAFDEAKAAKNELRDVRAESKRLTSENESQQRSIRQLKISLDEANVAKHEIHDVRAENNRLTSENESHQRSISQLKIALDEAKAARHELRDVQAENKHLTSENESQQRSISQLKITLDEAKATKHELRDVQAENKRLTSEIESQQRSISQLKITLDEAKAAKHELRDVQAENKRLTSENESQQCSISQLKIALDEAKHEQGNSLNQIKDQLRVANSSLTLLNMEKKGWQDKLDSMQHKLNAAERQVRCLDHLTRRKLESRHEADCVQPKRRGLSVSIPASKDVIEAMTALNEEINQICVQLVEGLERTAVYSSQPKPQAQKVLGVHLTAMMEDQATSSGYNMLLLQTVLEVFMTHWCSSIIEAFYPQQESFADLLVQLSTQTAKTSGK